MGFIQYDSTTTVTQGGGGGGGVTDLSDWVNRSAGSDGDVGQASTGALYVYSADAGEWVRPEVYAGTVVLGEQIVGTEGTMSALTTAGWTDSTSGTVSVSTDGTKTTLTRSAGAATAQLRSVLGLGASGLWACGYVQFDPTGSISACGVHCATSSNGDELFYGPYNQFGIDHGNMRNVPNTTNYGLNIAGFSNYESVPDVTTAEVWIDVLVRNGTNPNMYVWIDHTTLPFRIGDILAANSLTGQISLYLFDASNIKVRQFRTGTW